MDRFEYVLEHGIYSQTAEDCDIAIHGDSHITGACSFEGTLMRDADTIPFALPAESTVRKASIDGRPATITNISPGVFSLTIPDATHQGSSHTLTLEYEGVFADGAKLDRQGNKWLELQCMTVWKPVFGFDPVGRSRSQGRLVTPASYHVVGGMGQAVCHMDGDRRIIQWDTGCERCTECAFIVGQGHWEKGQYRNIELQALVMYDVPYGTAEVLQSAGKLLSLYEDMWGPYPFTRLSIACPPSSVSGNRACEGLIIAGMVGERSPATGRGFAILTHEIAHEWWAYSVYFDYRKLGLLEPLAAYGAVRAMRHYFPEGHQYELEGTLAAAKDAEQSGTPLIDCTWATPSSWHLRESKGACVWLLLEKLAGTKRLDAALREFATAYKGRYAGADEVRAVFYNAGGEEGDRLFTDYVLGTKPIPDTLDAYLI